MSTEKGPSEGRRVSETDEGCSPSGTEAPTATELLTNVQ